MKIRTLTALLIAVAIGPAHLQAQPFIEKLPQRTLLYVGSNGASPELMQSRLGELLKHPSLASLPERLVEGIAESEDMAEGERKAIESLIGAMAIAIQRPAALGLVSISSPDQEAPSPELALMVDLGQSHQTFSAHYDVLVKLMRGEGAPLQETTIQGVKLLVLPIGPGVSVSFGLHQRTFYLVIGKNLAREILTLQRADSLAAEPTFTAAMGKHAAGPRIASLFSRGTGTWLEQISPYVAQGDQKRKERFLTEASTVLDALGAGGIQSVSATISPGDQGRLHSLLRIDSPAPHKGLLSPFGGPAVTDADFAETRADAVYAAATRLDPTRMLLEVAGVMRSIPDLADSRDGLDEMFNGFESATGVHPLTGIYDAVGDSWLISLSTGSGGFPAGLELSVTLKDADTLAGSLGRLTEVFNKMMLEERRKRRHRLSGMPTRIHTLGEGDDAISYLAIRERRTPMPIAPAWRIREGRLRIAAWPQVLQASERQSADRLVETDAYRALRKRLPAGASIVTWADEGALVRHLYPWTLTLWTLASNAVAAQEGAGLMPHWLWEMPRLTDSFGPGMTVAGAEEGGIYLESEGTLPLGIGAIPALVPAVQSGSIPVVAYARRQARRTVAAHQIRMLSMNAVMYAAEHDGRIPVTLAQLVIWAKEPQLAVSPVSGKEPPKIEDGKLVGDVDYTYLPPANGAFDKIKQPAEYILIYEDAANYQGRGTWAAYADGHVEWLTSAQLKRALEARHR